MSLGFWSKSKKNTTAAGGVNPLKVDAIFATDNSGSMNSYLNWEDDPATVSEFNFALSKSGIGASNLEIVDDNNANRISRTFFSVYKRQVISSLMLVRVDVSLSGQTIALGSSFTIKRAGVVVGSAGDYIVYSWYSRPNTYDSNITYNEFIFESSTGGAGSLENVNVGDTVENSSGTSFGTVTYVERLSNPYRYYVSGDLRLRYFWAKKAGDSGTYVKNSVDDGSTGSNSEDAYGIIHKTIGVNLNGSTQPNGTVIYDDFKPRASSKLIFVANTNEHDTPCPFSLDETRNLLLKYNGVYIANIGAGFSGIPVSIIPQVKSSFDYNGGSNGVPAGDPRGFQPISDYVTDLLLETITPADSLNTIPDGWYRGIELEIKDVESVTSSAAVQARSRPKVRVDLLIEPAVVGSNKSVKIVKVVFPGYGFVVGDTLTPPALTGSLFGSLHDKLVFKVARVKDIDYSSASKRVFSGVYTKDFNRIVFLNEVGPVTNLSIPTAGSGYSNATARATFYEFDQASGFNNVGDGSGLTVDITTGSGGDITGVTVNNGGDLYAVNDKLIIQHPSPGTITALNSSTLVGGTGYGTSTTVNGASLGNFSGLATGSGATCNYTTNSSGVITSVTLVSGGLNYKSGDVLFIQGGDNNARITIQSVNENAIVSVSQITANAALRERAYLSRDLTFITRGNNPTVDHGTGYGTTPQSGAVAVSTQTEYIVSTTQNSNVLTITGGTGSIPNIDVGDYVWNRLNTTVDGTTAGVFSLSPPIPWDVRVLSVNTSGGVTTVEIDAAANSTTTNTTVYIGTRRVSTAPYRWDHTTLARETGGAVFFQVGPDQATTGVPLGIAYYDNTQTYGNHSWETITIFGNLNTVDYRVQFGRSIGKTVGDYLFKVA